MQYNWYPGHMVVARRKLTEEVRRLDVVLEVADARIVHSSRNPDLKEICAGKPRILLLNKIDLADPAATERWLAALSAQGEHVVALQATQRGEMPRVRKAIAAAVEVAVARSAQRGMKKTVRGMVVGVPNSGKSTLLNSLRGTAVAKTADRAGVTRTNQWVKVTPYLEMMDTPGLLWPRMDDQTSGRMLALVGSMRDDAIDPEETARALLEVVSQRFPGLLARVYGIDDTPAPELLELICGKKGWLLPGAMPDTLRGARQTLDAFRGGRWGRLTLEQVKGPQEDPKYLIK